MTFESFYREIVPQERIVYTSTMSSGAGLAATTSSRYSQPASGGGRARSLAT